MLITYLFGAGASCEVLPLVDGIPKRMNEISLKLEKFKDEIEANLKDELTLLIDDINLLSAEAAKHASVDTYAKKLFLTQNWEKFNWLKRILSYYFTIEQLFLAGKCDSRYDTLWASLAGKHSFDLPKNVRILSWNYDLQFELSFAEYESKKSLGEIQNILGVVEKTNDKRIDEVINQFGIYKLNGTANTIKDFDGPFVNDVYILDDFKDGLTAEKLNNLLKSCKGLKDSETATQKKVPSLSFAWEEVSYKSTFQKTLLELIKDEIFVTEILVVIGYSFPFFNRDIDRELIRSMKLKKIYIQDPHPDQVISSFRSIIGDMPNDIIEPVGISKQFFLPPELD